MGGWGREGGEAEDARLEGRERGWGEGAGQVADSRVAGSGSRHTSA